MILRFECEYCEIGILYAVENGKDYTMECPKCGGKLKIVERIVDKEIVEIPIPAPVPMPNPWPSIQTADTVYTTSSTWYYDGGCTSDSTDNSSSGYVVYVLNDYTTETF